MNTNRKLISRVNVIELVKLYKSIDIDISQYFTNIDNLDYIYDQEKQIYEFMPKICGDSKFYSALNNKISYYDDEKFEFIYASKILKRDSKILDIGCGEGAFANHIPDDCFYLGTDFSVHAQHKKGTNKLLTNKLLSEIYSEKGQFFDIITIFQVIEHVANPYELINDALKLLKPNGRIIITAPNAESYLGNSYNNILDYPPHHVSRWDTRSMKTLSSSFNLSDQKIKFESLRKEHARYYMHQKLLNIFFKGDNIPMRTDLKFRLISKILWIIAYIIKPRNSRSKIKGHTILLDAKK